MRPVPARPDPAWRPPAPKPRSVMAALASALLLGPRDALALLPEAAYESLLSRAPMGRRPIFIVNHPGLVRRVLVERVANYPKSDLMVGALEPLVGDGIFISGGATWARQRAMIDPAFAHMRIEGAFGAMRAAVEAALARLDAAGGRALTLDEEMSRLTADIVFRTIFSEPIEGEAASAVFHAFADYQNAVPQIEPKTMLETPAWAKIEPSERVRRMCAVIREKLGALIDLRLASGERRADIAGDVIAARDPETGRGFGREELVDQIAVFFLAGHETSASALTWAFFILSQRPEHLLRIRAETEAAAGSGPVGFGHLRALTHTRNLFREVLRLYPPVSFITRVALAEDELAGQRIPKGALMVISPWLIQRHRKFWRRPDAFDPDRWLPERATRLSGKAWMPFGLGPRVCTGASFAQTESALILAELCRRFDLACPSAARVMPVGKLTTRPGAPVSFRFLPRG